MQAKLHCRRSRAWPATRRMVPTLPAPAAYDEPRSQDLLQCETVTVTFSMTVSACMLAHPALPSPLMHRPIPTQQANANAAPTLANRHLHPSEATHRHIGVPDAYHSHAMPPATQITHTNTDISATNAGKATLPYEPRLASDKTHDANCRHQPMTSLDLRTFCNVRL